jgi:predicted CXXCH cytochrome family protein
MTRLVFAFFFSAASLMAVSSKTAVVGSQHDLSVTGGPIKSTTTEACIFCHAPHNVTPNITPLWDHSLSTQTYTTYTSSTYNSGPQTPASGSSKLCLSCHDGTVAMGLTVTKGLITTTGTLASATDILGANLSTSHPVSMAAVDDGSLALSLFGSPPATKDPAVLLVAGKIECTTCHDPHAPRNDPVVPMFLTRSNLNGALCLACHDPTRASPSFLNGWTSGAHATATNTVSNTTLLGSYPTVGNNACWSCHNAHNNGVGPRSLKAVEEVTATSTTGPCAPCHGTVTTNISASAAPAVLNIMSEYAKAYAHPTITVTGVHDPAETVPINSARHAECADCHNPHSTSLQSSTAVAPALPADLVGVRGYDTTGLQNPATREYQTCYQCHADSTNKPATSTYGRTAPRFPAGPMPAGYAVQPPKPADQYNIRLKFESTIGHNISGHAVMTTTVSSLLPYMLNTAGTSNTSRPLTTTTQLYCIDCHNNNAARSSGGTGPNGPHGSTFRHLLQFDLLQDGSPGGGGSGAGLCGKCHNLTTVRNESPHGDHNGVGCTTCHDPHGVIGGTPAANRAMQNFDTGVAAKSTTYFGYYYNSANQKGCYTNCHGENHNPHNY